MRDRSCHAEKGRVVGENLAHEPMLRHEVGVPDAWQRIKATVDLDKLSFGDCSRDFAPEDTRGCCLAGADVVADLRGQLK